MTDSMKKAFDDAVDKIEDVYDDINRIFNNVCVEMDATKGKEREEYADYADFLSSAMECINQARFLVDYVKRKKS